jgi:hypothetical protein
VSDNESKSMGFGMSPTGAEGPEARRARLREMIQGSSSVEEILKAALDCPTCGSPLWPMCRDDHAPAMGYMCPACAERYAAIDEVLDAE